MGGVEGEGRGEDEMRMEKKRRRRRRSRRVDRGFRSDSGSVFAEFLVVQAKGTCSRLEPKKQATMAKGKKARGPPRSVRKGLRSAASQL